MSRLASRLLLTVTLLVPAAVVACAPPVVMKVQRGAPARTAARWVVLPFANHSDTPQAGQRVEALVATVLRARGIGSLDAHPPPKAEEPLTGTTDQAKIDESIAWAKGAKFDYAVTGSVEEWRYKSGIDAEPAVGLSVRVLELSTGKVVWSASGTKTGRSADNASGTALTLVDTLVENLDLAP